MLIDVWLATQTTIHKHITLSAVTMHVTKQQNLMVSMALLGQHLSIENGWMKEPWGVGPTTVQVDTQSITAIVAKGHTVRVQHRNYFEDESLSQKLSFFIVLLKQKVYDSLYDVGWIAFTWVDSRCQKDDLFVQVLILYVFCYSQHIARKPINGVT